MSGMPDSCTDRQTDGRDVSGALEREKQAVRYLSLLVRLHVLLVRVEVAELGVAAGDLTGVLLLARVCCHMLLQIVFARKFLCTPLYREPEKKGVKNSNTLRKEATNT